MTPQDRERFQALRLRQTQLEEALAQLRSEFREFEQRAELDIAPVEPIVTIPTVTAIETLTHVAPPPLPITSTVEEQIAPKVQNAPAPLDVPPPFVPTPEPPVTETATVTAASSEKETEIPPTLPPLPLLPEIPAIAQAENSETEKRGEFEFQFGRWLARIGVVFGLITLISFSTMAYQHFHHLMGPWSKLTVLALVSVGMLVAGLRIERKNSALTVYGRTLAGGGLACLYYTLYGATYVTPLQVIHSQLFGGCLLLGWSAYVLYLAEKKKSELLSVFAIALAYFSSAITPVGDFTMVANLILSLTAVIFLVRNAWTGLSYLCLIGTYVGLLRQFIVYDSASDFWFELVHGVAFWPVAIYLAGAWIIYTAGVFLAQTPSFAAGKRMAFLCLNNGALIGLLTMTSSLSEFGHTGAILCVVGGTFIATSYFAQRVRAEASEVAEAYLMQGLALATGGMVMAYTGVTRGLLITVESVFLAAAAAYSRNWIMRIAAYISAFLGVGLLLNEITPTATHPWILIIGGAAAMLANAWLARREFWKEAREIASRRFVYASAYYVLLAIAVLGIGIFRSPLTATWIAPVMALVSLALTFSIYLIPLLELPVLIQVLLGIAIGAAIFPPVDSHPLWNELVVGAVIMILASWWPRQSRIRIDSLPQSLLAAYALAMVAISTCAVHPLVDAQGWMICASLLSLAFLLYGIFARTWSFAAAGQILLGVSLYNFFSPETGTFPWTWWAAIVPIATTFFTAWLVQEWLRTTKDLPAESEMRAFLRSAVCVYQGVTVALIVRLIFGLVPDADIPLCFYAVGTVLMAWNLKWSSSMGVRCAMVLDLFGTLDYLTQVFNAPLSVATWPNAFGLVCLFAQPTLLRRWGTALVSIWEIYGVTFLANFCLSTYVYWIIHPRVDAQEWMIIASILSLLYLAYGAWSRMWQFILSGQVYLGLAIWTFLALPLGGFPWTWWVAVFPPAVVFLTGWLIRQWLPRSLNLSERWKSAARIAAIIYQSLALGLAIRWIFGVVPAEEDTLALFAFATALVLGNVLRPSAFGVRAGLIVSLVGVVNYLSAENVTPYLGFTWIDAGAVALFLVQPAILRRWGRELVTLAESWAVILLSSGMGWIYVSHYIIASSSNNMTLAWAIFALVVTMIGFAANERRQRWCGLVILAASIIRVGVYDFWFFSDLYKVLTFFALTVICLGLSFLYYKFGDRLKELL